MRFFKVNAPPPGGFGQELDRGGAIPAELAPLSNSQELTPPPVQFQRNWTGGVNSWEQPGRAWKNRESVVGVRPAPRKKFGEPPAGASQISRSWSSPDDASPVFRVESRLRRRITLGRGSAYLKVRQGRIPKRGRAGVNIGVRVDVFFTLLVNGALKK